MPLRRNSAHALWMEQHRLVEGFLAGGHVPHAFITKFIETAKMSKDAFADFVHYHQRQFEDSLLQPRMATFRESTIPLVTHRIWLTSLDRPHEPSEEFLNNIASGNRALDRRALHYFWTNSPGLAEALRKRMQAAGCSNVVFTDFQSLQNLPAFGQVVALIEEAKFVLAADILKIIVLHRYGGVYCDLGIVFDQAIFDLVQLSSFTLLVSNTNFFQTSFLACSANSPLTQIFLAVLDIPHALDSRYAIMGSDATALDEVHIFSGLGFTCCTLLFMPAATRILMLAAQSDHLQWRSSESWYGSEAKFGNVLIEKSSATLVSSEEFYQADLSFIQNVQIFGNFSPFVASQLRILTALHEYFEVWPTEACKIFYFQGSDKALGWHNYTYIYSFLLGMSCNPLREIFEVGIGTNHLDVLSTMGVSGVPGASLRAWKEAFPAATVVGADVDVRILFQEPGIETYWVDQTRSITVSRLFENIGGRQFDLAIDDGLHTFEANRILFEGAYSHLAADGMYIIEDVTVSDRQSWLSYLKKTGIDAAIVQIPHASNHLDNRIILVPGGQIIMPLT